MGVRSILRATQQSLPKRISSIFSSDFVGSSIVGDVVTVASRRKWSFLRGTWGVSSSKLTTSTAASSYPVTVVDALSPDIKIELKDIGQGVGAAIWVTDSGNWWAAAPQQESQNCNCSTSYYSCNCNTCSSSYCSSYFCSCGNSNYSVTCSYNPPSCEWLDCQTQYGNFCSSRYANGNCSEYTQISWQDCFCAFYYSGNYTCTGNYYDGTYNCCCSQTYYYNCNCQTCSSTSCETCYPQYMRIIQSAANTVSEILKWQVSNIVKSIRVFTSNKTITVKSYSDTSLQTEIDSKIYDAPSSAQETTRFGVVVSPSSYNQSGTISEINIERGV
jgi:hypothetical protein